MYACTVYSVMQCESDDYKDIPCCRDKDGECEWLMDKSEWQLRAEHEDECISDARQKQTEAAGSKSKVKVRIWMCTPSTTVAVQIWVAVTCLFVWKQSFLQTVLPWLY